MTPGTAAAPIPQRTATPSSFQPPNHPRFSLTLLWYVASPDRIGLVIISKTGKFPDLSPPPGTLEA